MSAIFKTTGPLDFEKDRAIYVERAELQDILHEVRRPYVESYVALLGPRQTGKTTLLFRVYRELKRLGEPVGFLDLSAYRVESPMQSYAHAALKIGEELDDTLVSPGKLRALACTVDSPIRFREFLLELARDCKGARIVILLDEVGPFMSSLGFFETLRSISASGGRDSEQAFKKYLFVFAGTVDLHELTTGQNSPLANVCTPVYLDGFGLEGTELLVSNLKQVAPVDPDVVAYLHEQTHGHPYLTQRICSLIEADEYIRQQAQARRDSPLQRVTPRQVDAAIDQLYEGDENLRYIALQLERYAQARELLRQMMIEGVAVPFTLIDPRVARLFVMGAVRKVRFTETVNGVPRERSRCQVSNPIYEHSLHRYFEALRMSADGYVRQSVPQSARTGTSGPLVSSPLDQAGVHPAYPFSLSSEGSIFDAGLPQEPTGSRNASPLPPAVDPWNYLDLHLHILPRPDLGQPFPLTVDSWAGIGTGQVELDVQDPKLWAQIRRLEHNEVNPDDLRDLGTTLWRALFSAPDIERRYSACHAEAINRKGIRIKLEIEPPTLAALPWEYLYDPESQTFPALSPRTPVTRYIHPRQHEPPPLAVEPPLRILLVSAEPAGEEPIDVETEQAQILQAMAHLQQAGKVEIESLENATVRTLQTMLRRPFHVLHYIGHGVYDERAECGMLALEDESGDLHAISAPQLQYMLGDTTIRLGVFNACMTAHGAAGRSIAGELMRAGLSATLAMEFAIPERSAIVFAGEFYRTLADGWPVDAAVAEGRKAMMFATDLHAMDWGIPVLFMRAHDGMLFRFG